MIATVMTMPNRIIKESLCSSEKISALSDFEFRLWIGLIIQADDYGRGDARPAIIKGHVFPLRERLSLKDIENSLVNLAAGGCVALYEVDGKPYYQFPNWSQHQRIRNAKPKFPPPNADKCGIPADYAADSDRSPRDAASCGELRPESNPIQSESNPFSFAREDDKRPRFDTVEAYAASNLECLSPTNMDELVDFLKDMSEEMVRHAIDEACAHGVRQFAYVRKTLQNYRKRGHKTLGDVKAWEERREREKTPPQPASPPARKVREFK